MTINFNTEPYNDDYDATKEFYRVLFRPGYAVQARELTQLQTILQNQITKFGDHIFKNGSQVIPGSVNVDNKFHFLKLENTHNNENIFAYINTFRNKIITGVTSGVKMRVIDTSECDCVTVQTNIATLYCKIEGTADDGTTKRMVIGEEIVAYEADNQTSTNFLLTENQNGDITAQIRNLGDAGETATAYNVTGSYESSNVIGNAYGVDVKEGIYYIDGFFVRNPELHLYVGRFTTTPTARVGFKVNEIITVPEKDTSLLDNATGVPNFAAPGAHRYRINLTLVDKTLNSVDEDRFIELLRLKDGVIQHKVEKATYAELERTLARRTFDESGNYEVNKFKLSLREHLSTGGNNGVYVEEPASPEDGVTYGDPNKFVMVIDPGKAYIQGYEVESVAAQFVTFDKARPQTVNGVTTENGHIVRLDDVNLGIDQGSYVLVDTVHKFPNFEQFEKVFLVNKRVATNGAAPLAADIVGTARIKSFQLHDGDYTDGALTKFKLGLMDIQLYPGKSFEKNVKAVHGRNADQNFTCNLVSVSKTLVGSATASTSSTAVTGSGTNFTESLVSGDYLYVNDQLIGRVSTITNNLALTLDANSLASVTNGQVKVFRSSLKEPNAGSLLFNSGFDYVKSMLGFDGNADTLNSTTATVRQISSVVSSSAGVVELTLSGTRTFPSNDDLENFTVINNETGSVVNIDNSDIQITNSSTRIVISGLAATKSHTLILSVNQTNTAAAAASKTLQEDYENLITGKKSVTGSVVELAMADVLRIKSVHMTAGDFTSFDTNNFIDITDRYTLDDGQRDTHYTNSKLVLRAGAAIPTGALRVTYDYFTHGTNGDYFSVDSYSTIPYDDIPNYFTIDPVTGVKKEFSLSGAIDFRPIVDGNNKWYPNLPKIGSDINTSIAYYIGRQDKLILDSIGRFNVLQGVPALLPQEPADPVEGMVIATIFVPPYTSKVGDIKMRQRDNRRYTMRDIGKIDRRVTNLEYYVVLNLLEKDTQTLSIRDVNTGLDKFKNGFIVDQFTGHGIGDVKHPDYRVAVDSKSKQLRAMHFTSALEVVEDLASGAERSSQPYKRSGDLITLPFVEEEFVTNRNASRSIDVNPYKIGAFKGEILLVPEGDNWKDTDRRPDLQVTDDNNYDAIKFMADELGVTGSVWDEWQTNWTGSSTEVSNYVTGNPNQRRQTVTGYEETVTTETGIQSREGIQTNLTSTVNTQDYGDRVVDISYASYMRPRPIVFIAKNLKGNTKVYPFFDSVSVTNYVKPADVFKVTRNSGAPVMNFGLNTLAPNILADDPARAYSGNIEPAFQIGDVISNLDHTPTTITAVGAVTTSGVKEFTVSVGSVNNISPGHHVELYNMDFYPETIVTRSLTATQSYAQSTVLDNAYTAKQLNKKIFIVKSISSNALTLIDINGADIPVHDAYVPASGYAGTDRGLLKRLTATGVVSFDGYVHDSDTAGNVTQDIHVTNIRNGFAVNETISGSTLIGSTSNYNQVTINAINGNDSQLTNVAVNATDTVLKTDVDGTVVGTFFLPQNENIAFRTGERQFKLTDNISNSDADFDSKGQQTYFAMGMTLSKERTIVNTRTATFTQDRLYEEIPVRRTSTSTRVLYSYYTGHDPVAQTFTVRSTGGCFVTSIDLFFSEAGNRPVTVELRSTNNDVPSTKIVPMSEVTKSPQEINTSSTGSAATTFTFQAPIYLQDNETYAIIVKTDEPGCQLFVSELAQVDLITGNTITSQPLTGSLYLSQNSREFEINPLLDMKFVLRKASFDTSATVTADFRANPPAPYALPRNPFEITPNTNLVRVYAPNHGFLAGEKVVISGVADGNYGTTLATTGIPAYVFNTGHIVSTSGLEKDSFVIDLVTVDGDSNSMLVGGITNANFTKGRYGNTGVIMTRSLNLDVVYLKTSDLNFQDTNLKYYVNAQNVAGTFTDYLPLVANSNYTFNTRMHIKTYENQNLSGGAPVSSLRFRAQLSSDNSNVSPVIDMQKISSFCVTNNIGSLNQAGVNVVAIDSRVLLQAGDVTEEDRVTAGSGTITVSGSTVTGSATSFVSQVFAGDVIRKLDNTVIGTVQTVNSDTSITLTGTATTISTGISFEIVGADADLIFANNSDGFGTISANLDAGDNLLDNAIIGRYITISGVASGINGTYAVKDVQILNDNSVYAGNVNQSKVTVVLNSGFSSTSTISMITDNDFKIEQLDRYTEDWAPIGSTNYANYITRPLNLATAAESIKVLFDGNIVSGTDVKVYYRTWDGQTNLNILPFEDSGWSVQVVDASDTFRERSIDIEDIPPFTTVQVKIVLKSTDGTKVPRLKNFRMIAHS